MTAPDQSRLRVLLFALVCVDAVLLTVLALALDHSHEAAIAAWTWELPLLLACARFFAVMLASCLAEPTSAVLPALGALIAVSGVVAGAVEFSKAPEPELKDEWHARVVFALEICFSVFEGLLMALAQSIAKAGKAKRVSPPPSSDGDVPDVEKPLLLQARNLVDEDEYVPEDDPRKGQGATFTRVMSLAYPERYILAVATVALFVSSIASTVIPALFGRLIQTISVSKDEGELNRTMLYLVVLMTVSSLFAMIRGALYTLAGERLVARFRVRLFDSVLHNDISFFDTSQSGELQSRLSTDTGVLQNAVTVNVSMLLRWLVQLISSLIIIFYISWKLTLIMLGIVPALAIGARMYGFFIQRISKDYQAALASAAETAEEAFGNIRTVRSFSKEGYEVVKYRKRILDSYEFGKRRAWAYGIFLGVVGLLAFWAIALVLWLGGRMVIRGTDDLSSSDLTSFLLYTMNLSFALGGLSEIYSTLSSAVGSSQRMFELLDKIPSIGSRKPLGLAPGRVARKARGGKVVFKNVRFSYPSRDGVEVLKGISLECVQGTVNALVGPSGGGKSTVVALTERFYDPTAGVIEIDGVPLTSIEPYELHQRMAVVSQEPALFACSIADNMAYGLSRYPTQAELEEAARKSNALEFISRFPKGFDTLVGERGVQLSGGQKQRIAIARAMLVDPEILLLDEATSALDSESEHLVQEALNELMKDRTTLVVAHRLSTVRDAHQILVLDGGLVAERGSHEQLIADKGGLCACVRLNARQLTRAQTRHWWRGNCARSIFVRHFSKKATCVCASWLFVLIHAVVTIRDFFFFMFCALKKKIKI